MVSFSRTKGVGSVKTFKHIKHGGAGASGSGASGRVTIVLWVISRIVFTLSAREAPQGPIHTTKAFLSVATTPVRQVGAFICSPFTGLSRVFTNITASENTLSELQQENATLRAQNAQLVEAKKSADRLQDLLKLKSAYKLQSLAAHVISSSTDSWTSTITIDKGSTSGLSVGMPVTDSTAVIGQISSVGPNSATVRLVSDESSSVSAMIQSSRAQGMLVGSADGSLRMTLVSVDQSVSVGDTVVTSGLGGVYPKGLPLGTVSSVEKSANGNYYDIAVKPISSNGSFEEVLVVTAVSDEQHASAEEVQAADGRKS